MGVIFVVVARAKVSSLRGGLPWTLDAFSRFHFASGRRKSFFPPSRPILFKRQLSLFGASLQGSGNVTNGSEENEGIVLGHQKAPTLPEFSGFQINCIHHQRPSTD
jgi:hypothetical protein